MVKKTSKYTYNEETQRLTDVWGTIGFVDSSSAMVIIAQLEKRDKRIVELEKRLLEETGY